MLNVNAPASVVRLMSILAVETNENGARRRRLGANMADGGGGSEGGWNWAETSNHPTSRTTHERTSVHTLEQSLIKQPRTPTDCAA